MPLIKYFAFVGSALTLSLIGLGWCLPQPLPEPPSGVTDRPAIRIASAEKRQGTKSREVGHWLSSERYEDLMPAPMSMVSATDRYCFERRQPGKTPPQLLRFGMSVA